MIDFDGDPKVKNHLAKLFPAVHISSTREAELRATSGLLSMVRGVSAFGRSIVRSAGGPRGLITCYAELPFSDPDPGSKDLRPDGIIRVKRGRTEWVAVVEVKVGNNPLAQDQIDAYHRLAGDQGFNALITISNQAALPDGLPPVKVDGRRARSIPVIHLSWERLLSEARLLSRKKAVEDPDQQWMLDEWILYVGASDSKIMEPQQLGPHWKSILDAAKAGNLGSVASHLAPLATNWDAYLRKEALRLRASLGVEVRAKIPRGEQKDPSLRIKNLTDTMLNRASLSGEFQIPDAPSDLSVSLMLPAKSVKFGARVSAPEEGRQKTRLNWLAGQLKRIDAPDDLVVKVIWDQKRLISQASSSSVKENVECLLRDGHLQRISKTTMPRHFELEWTRSIKKGKGKSTAPVLEGISHELELFYGSVVSQIKAYRRPSPTLSPDTNAPDGDFVEPSSGG